MDAVTGFTRTFSRFNVALNNNNKPRIIAPPNVPPMIIPANSFIDNPLLLLLLLSSGEFVGADVGGMKTTGLLFTIEFTWAIAVAFAPKAFETACKVAVKLLDSTDLVNCVVN